MDFLISKRVDLVLQGHDHDYQRSKQLTCANSGSFVDTCVADDGSDNLYTKGAGTVFVIAGMFGGGGSTSVSTSDSDAGYYTKAMGANGGFDLVRNITFPGAGRGVMQYTVSANRIDAKLLLTYQDVAGSPVFSDSFSITK